MPENKPKPFTADNARIVRTDAWQLRVPSHVGPSSPLLVIPTVHPRGDRRIIRCAQVALDAGLRVQFIWLGEGEPSADPSVSELLMPSPRHAADRIRMVTRIAKLAAGFNPQMWHIHDFYFLRAAKKWHRGTGRPVLYDVHEHYAAYYSSKLPLTKWTRRIAASLIERYQVSASGYFGAANVVSDEMAVPFRQQSVPVSVSPNYPLLSQYQGVPDRAFASRRWTVLHIGTLSQSYGTELLVQLASRSAERSLPFQFKVLSRYPSPDHAAEFEKLLADMPRADSIEMLSTRPTHEIPELLATAGFGLSLLETGNQNEIAIASKLFEHTMAGLVSVVTPRGAQRAFVEAHAVSVVGDATDVDAMLDGMMRLAARADATDAALRAKAVAARERFTWEKAVEPELRRQLLTLLDDRQRSPER